MGRLHTETIAGLQASAASAVADTARRFEERDAIRGSGKDIDDAGLRAIHGEYQALPEAQRPKTVVEWFVSLTPETAPRPLREYLRAPEGAEKTAEKTGARRPKIPDVDRGKGKAPEEPDISRMSDEQYDAWLHQQRISRLTP